MKPEIEFMREIAREIIALSLTYEKTTTLQQAFTMFYDIMEKYGIARTTKVENGFEGDNPEWTICRVLFESTFDSYCVFEGLFDSNMPDKLLHY
jgi:hypothetical protein